MAAHCSGRAPVRGDAGPAAGVESGGRLEADRREPRQVRAESRPALPGAAAVRLLGAARVSRRAARADVRADGRVRGRKPGFDPPSYSRSNTATSIVRPGSSRSDGRMRTDASSTPRRGSAGARFRCRRSRSTRSTNSGRGKTACCSSRTRAGVTSTSATSIVVTGSQFRRRLGSSRCATSTTCATPTPRSRSVPACRSSPSHASWARASR